MGTFASANRPRSHLMIRDTNRAHQLEGAAMSPTHMRELPLDECLALLRGTRVGRIGIVRDEFPYVVPVNYRLVEYCGRTWVAIRTRPGNIIETAAIPVAFEIDGIDPARHHGWSVLARGTLHHLDPDAADFRHRFDPEPWLDLDRDAWMVIDPFQITGRELHGTEPEQAWAFSPRAYS